MRLNTKDLESKGKQYKELLTIQLLEDILKELKKLNRGNKK